MPKYFCEYCGIYLIHSSPKGRRQHNGGRKHKQNKIEYYQQFLQEINAPTPGSYLTSQQMQQKLQTKMGLNIPKPVNLKSQNPLSTPSISDLGQAPTPGLNMLNIPGIMPSNITSLQFSNPLVNQQQLLMQQQQMGLIQAPLPQSKPSIPSLMNIVPK